MRVLLPLPSLLRASAHDAGCARMRKDGRTKWNRDDYDAAADALDRLVAGCYGPGDEGRYRFQIAGELERAGVLSIRMSIAALNRAIDSALAPA